MVVCKRKSRHPVNRRPLSQKLRNGPFLRRGRKITRDTYTRSGYVKRHSKKHEPSLRNTPFRASILWYRVDQLPIVGRITSLKDMGFSLADIARILAVYDDPDAMERYFVVREAELRSLAEATAYRLTLLETARKRLRKETAQMHLTPDDPCYCSVVFHDGEFQEENVEVEAQKTVRGTYPDTEHVKFRTLPPVTYAGCTFKGSYAQIDDVVAAVSAWIEENGYEPDGKMFDIYHVSPHETDNPDEFVTEVCFPVKKG